MQEEHAAAKTFNGWRAKRRYREAQWSRSRYWRFYEAGGEQWNGFASVRPVLGDNEDILMVPLPGHSPGHAGIAVSLDQTWNLHAGDAYFFHDEVHGAERRCPPGLRFYQRMMDHDHTARVLTQNRLRALALSSQHGLRISCSHDAVEFQQMEQRL
jgi:glyoxylase-like metal-dependent hydrolase (beta-lactamase superfamily II)